MHGQPTILAIDPGSLKLGWAVVRGRASRPERVASGVLRMKATQSLPERLGVLLTELTALFDRFAIDELAIEAAFVHDNPHTALVLGQARGLPIALAASRGLPVHEYPPALVKRTLVGSGRAEKSQVQNLIALLLSLPDLPPEDEADALAVALTHLRRLEFAAQVPTPAALAAVAEVPMTPARALYAAALADAKNQKSARKSPGRNR